MQERTQRSNFGAVVKACVLSKIELFQAATEEQLQSVARAAQDRLMASIADRISTSIIMNYNTNQ